MVNSNTNIYTLQTDINNSEPIVHIETMISRGLYRFTLLGINPKYASDTKDRVYAALRSSELLNLKSDNRKIIVTLSPNDTAKKEGIYDLGIALSCISCIDKNLPSQNMLVVGGLSISGKILPTKRIHQTIYTAYTKHISIIVCSEEDKQMIDANTLATLTGFGMQIIAATYLKEVVSLLKTYTQQDKTDVSAKIHPVSAPSKPYNHKTYLEDMDNITKILYISLCGGHNSIIESQSADIFYKIYKNILAYKPEKTFGQVIYEAYTYKLLDTESKESVIYIENMKHIHNIEEIKQNKDTVIGLYTPCPCGYQYSFFEINKKERRCICSKRSLIQHKRSIEGKYFSVFDLKEIHTAQNISLAHDLSEQIHTIRNIQSFRYIHQNNMSKEDLFFFKGHIHLNGEKTIGELSDMLDKKALAVWNKSEKEEKVLKIAQTIQDIFDFESTNNSSDIWYQKEKPAVSEQALLLALSYLPKMDS